MPPLISRCSYLPREHPRVGAGFRVRRTVGVAFERDCRRGDHRRLREPLLQRVASCFAVRNDLFQLGAGPIAALCDLRATSGSAFAECEGLTIADFRPDQSRNFCAALQSPILMLTFGKVAV